MDEGSRQIRSETLGERLALAREWKTIPTSRISSFYLNTGTGADQGNLTV